MRKYLCLLGMALIFTKGSAQLTLPYNGFNIGAISGYYTDLNVNNYWNDGWKYVSSGPSVLLRLGDSNNKSDFVFFAAPVNNQGGGVSASMNEVMRIGGNGNVGIGTSAPGNYKLAVEGVIGSRSIKVTSDSWADFVFRSEYKLPVLREIEAYVKIYGHLPGIPSAGEIKQEGLDLGDMQKKQMQKIEELTLYLIEQNKQLTAQQILIQNQQRLLGEQDKRLKELEAKIAD